MPDLTPASIPLGHRPGRLLMSHDGRLLCALCTFDGVVCVIDTAKNKVTATIPCPNLKRDATLTHDGRLYASVGEGRVAVVDTAAEAVTGTLTLGGSPSGGVVSPDGARAYVSLASNQGIAVIDTATNAVTGPFAIGVGNRPSVLAMSADGDRIYAADESNKKILVVETESMSLLGSPIEVGWRIPSLALEPGGQRLFVPGWFESVVRAVDTGMSAEPVKVQVNSQPMDVAAGGGRLYVAHPGTQSVSVVDTADMSLVREFPAPGVQSLALSPDGELLYATSGPGKSVLVIPTRSRPVAAARESEGVAVSPDGRRLLMTLGGRNAVAVIGTPEKRIPVGGFPIAMVAPGDGREVYVADRAGNRVLVMDTVTDTVIETISFDSPSDLAAHPNGQQVYVVGTEMLGAIDTESRHLAEQITVPRSVALRAVETDGNRLYVTNTDQGTFSVYLPQPLRAANEQFPPVPPVDTSLAAFGDLTPAGTGRRVVATHYDRSQVFFVDMDPPPSASFLQGVVINPYRAAKSPDGPVYITSSFSHSVTAVDADAGAAIGDPIPVPGGPGPLAFAGDGRTLFVGSTGDSHVCVVDTTAGQTKDRFPAWLTPRSIAPLPNGRVYAANWATGAISVIETREKTLAVGNRPSGIAVSPQTKRAYVANSGAGTVTVIDLITGTPTGPPITVGGEPAGVAVGPSGKPLYVADAFNGSISVVDVTNGDLIKTLPDIGILLRGLAISPDGKRLYAADAQAQKVVAVDVAQGGTKTLGLPHPFGLAMTDDGHTLFVTLPEKRCLAVVDTATMTEAGERIRLWTTAPHGVCVAPDGRRLYVTDPLRNMVVAVDL
jgi:YVTN family beta-propeller protein